LRGVVAVVPAFVVPLTIRCQRGLSSRVRDRCLCQELAYLLENR
jgi:hypothetical protein